VVHSDDEEEKEDEEEEEEVSFLGFVLFYTSQNFDVAAKKSVGHWLARTSSTSNHV